MRMLRVFLAGGLLGLSAGCSLTDWCNFDAPSEPTARGAAPHVEHNPLFLPLTREDYPRVFETVLQVLDEYSFDVAESNRADGRIETFPRTAPGLGLFLKPGSPDLYERTLYTCQSYRQRVTVLIHGDRAGYFIEVQAYKELEDLPRPIRSTVGSAIFRVDNNIDRQFQVIDLATPNSGWLSKGRDRTLEQDLLQRIRWAM
jgi:hypothetical protein